MKEKNIETILTTENKTLEVKRFQRHGTDDRFAAIAGNDLYVRRGGDKYELLAKNYIIDEEK